jgi:hypothetical protein
MGTELDDTIVEGCANKPRAPLERKELAKVEKKS